MLCRNSCAKTRNLYSPECSVQSCNLSIDTEHKTLTMHRAIIPLIYHLNLQSFWGKSLNPGNESIFTEILYRYFLFWISFNFTRLWQRVLPLNTVQWNKPVFVLSLQSWFCNYALWKARKWPIPCFISWSSLDLCTTHFYSICSETSEQNLQEILQMWEPFGCIWAKSIFSLLLKSFPKKLLFIIAEENTEVFRELEFLNCFLESWSLTALGYASIMLCFPDALLHIFLHRFLFTILIIAII